MVVHVVLFSLWRVWNGGVCGIVFRRGMLCREDAGSGHEASKLVAKSASFTGRQDRPIRICTDASKKKQQLRGGEERRGEGKRRHFWDTPVVCTASSTGCRSHRQAEREGEMDR